MKRQQQLRHAAITDGDQNKGQGQKKTAKYKSNSRDDVLIQSLTHHGIESHETLIEDLTDL